MSVKAFSSFLIIVLLAACSPSSLPTSVASAPVPGPVVLVGEPEIHDLGPTTETVWNCGSGGGTVVKHPSISVVTNYAVEWEVGGVTGVGLTIGEGVVPGGVELKASLEGHYVTGFEQGIQQGTGWDLPAEPNTVVVYTLMWREVWQRGRVDVHLADESVVPVNVRFRTGVQSEVVGKQRQSCDEEQQPSAQPVTQQPETQPTAAAVTAQATNTPMVSIPRNHWPTSPQEAAAFFANGEGQWEINQYGGWHLIPQWPPIEVTVPLGVTMEGYNDGTNPPATRRCITVLGPGQSVIQGGTFWFPDDPSDPAATARKIHREQTAWTAENGGPTQCEAYGFQP